MCVYEVIPHSHINRFVHPSLHAILTSISPNARCKIPRYRVAATKEVSVSLSLPRVRASLMERDWTTLTLDQKCEFVISNRRKYSICHGPRARGRVSKKKEK